MKHLALLLLAVAGLTLQACSDNPEPKPPTNNNTSSSSSDAGEAHKPNAANGANLIASNTCAECHVDTGEGVFTGGNSGDNPFSVNDFQAQALQFDAATSKAEVEATLADYIEVFMPTNSPSLCDEACAMDIAAYLASYYIEGGVSSSVEQSSSAAQSSSSSDASSTSSDSSDSSTSDGGSSSSDSSASDGGSSSSDSSASEGGSSESSESSVVVGPGSSSNASSESSESSASSDASSDSSDQSSSVPAEKGDADNGRLLMDAPGCAGCHQDNGNGNFGSGNNEFNVNDFNFPTDAEYAGMYANTEDGLADYIVHEMPPFGLKDNCIDTCATDIAAYLWSLRTDESGSSSEASSSDVSSSSPASSSSEASSTDSSSSTSSSSDSSVIVVPSSSSSSSDSSVSSESSSDSTSSSVASSSSSSVVPSSSSSSVVPSSSSSVDSSSSVSSEPLAGDPVAGAAFFATGGKCALCHTELDDGTFVSTPITVNDFAYPAEPKYVGYSADSEAQLAIFIDEQMSMMPTVTDCDEQCSLDAAAYLWSLRHTVSSSSSEESSSSESSSSDVVESSSSSDESSSSSDVVVSSSSSVESSSSSDVVISSSSSVESSSSSDVVISSSSSDEVSSSSVASSSSSSVESSSSVVSSSSDAAAGDPVAGAALYADMLCSQCHAEQDDGSFFPVNFDVNDFAFHQSSADYEASEAGLAAYISASMPTYDASVCEGDCALDTAAYLWSLRDGAQSSSSEASSSDVSSSSSSAVSEPGKIELDATLDSSVLIDSNDGELLDLLLEAIGQDAFDSFQGQLDASDFDQELLSIYFAALAEVFASVDPDALSAVITGTPISEPGLSIARDPGLGDAIIRIDIDQVVSVEECDTNKHDCDVSITGGIVATLSSPDANTQAGYIYFAKLVLDVDSLLMSNGDGETEIVDTHIVINGFYVELDPLKIGGHSEVVTEVELLDINLVSSNGGVDLDVSISGAVGEIIATVDDDTVIELDSPSLTLKVTANGDSVGEEGGSSSESESSASSSESESSASSEASDSSSSSSESSVSSEQSSAVSSSITSSSSSVESSVSSESSSSAVSSSAGAAELNASLSESVSFSTADGELMDLILEAIGQDAFEVFQQELDQSDYDQGLWAIYLQALGQIFSTLDPDALSAVITGTPISEPGLSIARDPGLGDAIVRIMIDKVEDVDECSDILYHCSVSIGGEIVATINSPDANTAEGYIYFAKLTLDVGSLRLWNNNGEASIADTQVVINNFYVELDPLAIGVYPDVDTELESMAVQIESSNNGVELSIDLSGSVGAITANVGDEIELALVAPDLDLIVKAVGVSVDGGETSSSSVSSSEQSSSSSEASVSSVSSSVAIESSSSISSSVSSSVGSSSSTLPASDSFTGSLNETALLVGDGSDVTSELLGLMGQDQFTSFQQGVEASGFDTAQASVLLGGLSGLFSGVDPDSLSSVITGTPYVQEGLSIARDPGLGDPVIRILMDKTVEVSDCDGSYDCNVAVEGEIVATLSSPDANTEAGYVYFARMVMELDAVRMSNSEGEVEIFDSRVAINNVYIQLDPLVVGGYPEYPFEVESSDVKFRALNNGESVVGGLSGSVGEIIASIGDEFDIQLLTPGISVSVGLLEDGVTESSSSSSSLVSSSSSAPAYDGQALTADNNCLGCHAGDAILGKTASEIQSAIDNGAFMSTYSFLSAGEVDAIATYLQSL